MSNPTPTPTPTPIPTSVLILGSGVFGLSTAHALATHPSLTRTSLTLLDRHAFPAPDAASIDSSRIVRSDYADAAYARLGARALAAWRGRWGGAGRYRESGLVIVVDGEGQGEGEGEVQRGPEYMRKSLENVRRLGLKEGRRAEGGDIEVLGCREEIERVVEGLGGGSGRIGYVNWRSGWADAEMGMRYLRKEVEETGRVDFRTAEFERLLFAKTDGADKVEGVELRNGEKIYADLTILATGAWTGKFLDLRGIASATGQVLAYLDITQEEQDRLSKTPVLLNESTGMFVIPPTNRVLKVARHGYGYTNPVSMPNPERPGDTMRVSVPRTGVDRPNQWIPLEGERACRAALAEMIPSLASRPFTHTRICWYTDTPKGDWIIDHHPRYAGLFVATGGSGHAYKFLPVIGDKIVECVLGVETEGYRELWRWPERQAEDDVWTNDWRGGVKGMVLDEEMGKGNAGYRAGPKTHNPGVVFT
ncbi:hypothetical protein LTR50_005409 [Elasticomyces elasticus]|nr:hypothetical protein LTR50_005409 [Elasticomyces elasticus]